MNTIVRIGLIELAFGAMMGWAVAATFLAPQLLTRIGVVNSRRFLQAHLDYIMMGVLLIAVGLAVPALPGWLAGVVVYGAVMNATLFLPMAFSDTIKSNIGFQAVGLTSFIAMSSGLVLVALQ